MFGIVTKLEIVVKVGNVSNRCIVAESGMVEIAVEGRVGNPARNVCHACYVSRLVSIQITDHPK
jgi:hypothetical protein